MVYEASHAVKVPVIGMGGITDAEGAIEMMLAGASAVSVGTANFQDVTVTEAVVRGIEEYLLLQGVSDVKEIIGAVR